MGFEIKVSIEELRKRKIFLATPMYGGQCAGMYTRSVADLAALCAKYQIPLQLYFLFNESLITRARNYCADEFMRSDASQDVPVPSSGRVVRHTDIPSTRVPSRPVDVWLPPSYDGKTPHDILIMHDGQMLFDKSITWNGAEWGVDETLSDLITRRIVCPTLTLIVTGKQIGRAHV